MRTDCLCLIEKEQVFLVEGFTEKPFVVGFTKNKVFGRLPQDIYDALPFVRRPFAVAYLEQIHSAKIHRISAGGEYRGDGLFTSKENLVLVVKTADCLPIVCVDEKTGRIGVIHMGWRSAQKQILQNIPAPSKHLKFLALCGLRRCCYQVGEQFEQESVLNPFVSTREDKRYFDPVAFTLHELNQLGVPKENFFNLDICNHCSDYGLHSYRKEKTMCRTLSFIIKQ